jgi:hypothetical protein
VQATRPKGDTRTRAQQQADALVQLADNPLASGELPMLRTVQPQLIVTIALEDLLDPSTGPGDGRWRTHRPDGTEIAIPPRQ